MEQMHDLHARVLLMTKKHRGCFVFENWLKNAYHTRKLQVDYNILLAYVNNKTKYIIICFLQPSVVSYYQLARLQIQNGT